MSKSLAEQKRSLIVPKVLKDIRRKQDSNRAMQPQGSSAIRVVSLTGYQYFNVPNATVNPEYAFIDLELANADEVLIACLTRSAFVGYTNGTFVNADLDAHTISDDFFRAWLEYDGRPNPKVSWQVPLTPIETVEDRLFASIFNTALPFHKARISLKAGRTTLGSKPVNMQSYLFVYQIRTTIG